MCKHSHRVARPLASHMLCATRLLAGIIVLGSAAFNVRAQIVASPTGSNRPVIDNTANGKPLVQIVAPNAAGVSHNQYQQFDIGRGGAILNNATGNALTQQGGWVGANPNLGGNAARLIINEVNSTNPSQLRGYLEVAGQRAGVVVSNPNGIMVDGFGFINASRGTLTTGTPVFGSGGTLDSLRVTQGQIAVSGSGVNDQGTAQVDLIARSVQVNAMLWADRLNVVTGANQVNYADLGVQVIAGAGGAPTVAVDVAAIGGMYANSIRLIGTEAGVGVMSYGKMASAGDFSIDSAGKITLKSGLSAQGAMSLRAGALDNRGQEISAGGDLGIAADTLDNTAGRIRSNGRASLSLKSNYTHAQGDTISAAGDLAITTTGDFTNQAELMAGGKLSVQASNISNGKDGLLSAGQSLLLRAGQGLTNTGRIYGQDVAISAQTLTNDHEGSYGDTIPAGVIAARNSLNLGAATLINREHALMKSDGDIAIGGSLDGNNQATGQAASITNSSATIDAGGKLTISSASLLNTNAHFASEIRLDPSKTRSWTEYEIDGSSHVYASDEVFMAAGGGVMKLVVRATGGQFNDYTIREISETTRSTVVTASDPGTIVSRGNMLLSGGTVLNDKSVIVAGGALGGSIGGASNGGTNPLGEIYVHRDVVSIHRTTKKCAGGTKRCNDDSISYPSYDLPVTHFDLGLWTAQSHTAPDSRANPAAGQAPQVALLAPNQLYRPGAAPSATYYIETDPAFVNYRLFLSSDYMLGRLTMDPQRAQKRLGDGYYEQQLVNDQILRLTGRKNLGAYASNEDQYRALMDAGVTYAQSVNLTPGIALSAAQMAQLTSDMVWLVEQNVALPDGSVEKMLVPKVYLSRLRTQDMQATGALIAADSIDLKINGSLANAGTLRANTSLSVTATQDIDNTLGTIASDAKAGTTTLSVGRDFNNQSGTIRGNRVAILAGRDANIGTLANTSQSANGAQVALDRTGAIDAGTLTLEARRDVNLNAAVITTTGDATITATNNLNLNAVKTQDELNVTYDGRNHLYKKQEQANGTSVQAAGNVVLKAGNDITTQAAHINSGKALTATAGGSVNLGAATQQSSYDQETYAASSGVLSSSSVHVKDKRSGTQAVGSTLSGNTVAIQSGKDINIVGSNVVSTAGTQLTAQNNVNITTSQNTGSQTYSKVEKTSGVFSGGGVGVTVGSRTLENDQTSRQTTNNASTVGSTNGNVTIVAGQAYAQTGSQVLAPQGDIRINARKVGINVATDTADATQDTRFKQTGITLQVVNPVLSAIEAVQQLKQASEKVKDSRMKGLAAGAAALTVANTAAQVSSSAAPAGGIDLAISLGTSKSQSHSEQHSTTAIGSSTMAGRDLSITASGAGRDSNLNVEGSKLAAGRNTTVTADNQITLNAARSASQQHSSNSNSSASVGVSVGTSGLMVNVAASGGRGSGDGNDVSYTNTQVNAGNTLTITSGGDTTLKGAVVQGKQVVADVGGNLDIESLQDSSTYKSRQQSLGGSLSVGIGRGVSGSISASRSRVDGNYQSVTEQSAINAGDGGFQVKVTGNTALKGAKIASTDQAVDEGRNQFQTASLATSAINNKSEYKAESQSFSAGGGYSGGKSFMNGAGVGIGSASGSESSVTASGVSGIAGDTTVRSDKDSSKALVKNWDGKQLQEDVEAQAKIMEAFTKEAGKAVENYANNARKDLQKKLKTAETEEEKNALSKDIKDINMQERALNVLVGIVSGMGAMALTKEGLSAAAEQMRDLTIADSLKFAGVTDGTTLLSNASGPSDGVRGDGFKAGGVRVDLDAVCGMVNERCKRQVAPDGSPVLDAQGIPKLELDAQGNVIFDTKSTEMKSLAEFLEKHPEAQKMVGPTGGIQGAKGTLFGIPYLPGSWQDKLIEAFAGTHDMVGGKWSGLYDSQGNIKRGMTDIERKIYDNAVTTTALIPSAPFALSETLPPAAWNALWIILRAGVK